MSKLPIINIESLVSGENEVDVAKQIGEACREHGFFYISGHGIDEGLQHRLIRCSKKFFSLDMEQKMKIRMELGGKAWRGYFPVGRELTSGRPDLKEGIYFGQDLNLTDERVRNGIPMHGLNLYPENMLGFKETILEYMETMTSLSHHLMRAFSISLGLNASYFNEHYTKEPLTLFRIFHYPPGEDMLDAPWGVGEHTDYGVLTLLKQDEVGGLQVKSNDIWIDAPPIENTFICNIGDMLDKMTGGIFKSTPHRVLNTSSKSRLSFPFFFDPSWDAEIAPVYTIADTLDSKRWDGADVHAYEGTYGQYILNKVSKVFPNLFDE